eukprot:767063-Hanusia_phi.AAC.1
MSASSVSCKLSRWKIASRLRGLGSPTFRLVSVQDAVQASLVAHHLLEERAHCGPGGRRGQPREPKGSSLASLMTAVALWHRPGGGNQGIPSIIFTKRR